MSVLKRRHFIRQLGLTGLLISGVLQGCSTLSSRLNPEPPEVSLTGLKPLSFSLFQQEMEATLELINPNDFDLDIRAVRFGLDVNGKQLATGISNTLTHVPANGKAKMDVVLSTGLGSLFQQLMQFDGRALAYRLSGTVKVTGFSLTLPFEKTGEVALLQRS